MSGAVGAELREKIENPIKFQWGSGGAGMPPTTVYGFDSALLNFRLIHYRRGCLLVHGNIHDHIVDRAGFLGGDLERHSLARSTVGNALLGDRRLVNVVAFG